MAGALLTKIKSFVGIYDEPYDSQQDDYGNNGYYNNDGYQDNDEQDVVPLNDQLRNGNGRTFGGYSGGGYSGSSGGGFSSGVNNGVNNGINNGVNGGVNNSINNGGFGGGGFSGGNGRSDAKSGGSNIINLHPQKSQNYVLVSAKPDSLEDANLVCQHFKDRHVVIVNLDELDKRDAQRIFDFIAGAVFALDGEVFDITNRIFAIAPNYVDLISIQRDTSAKGFMYSGKNVNYMG